jgi:hypothetical protein
MRIINSATGTLVGDGRAVLWVIIGTDGIRRDDS